MMHHRKVLVLLLLPILLIKPVAGEVLTVENKGISFQLNITDAYYTDYQGDGKQNDVIGTFNLNITLLKALKNDYFFKLTANLTLPSGYIFEYTFNLFIPAGTTSLNCSYILIFWNHAIESGWYQLSLGLEIYQWGHREGKISIVFDPPSDETDQVNPPTLEQVV